MNEVVTLRSSKRSAPPAGLFTGLAAALLAIASAPAHAQTFPAHADWVALTRDGVPIDDPLGDAQGERDIVGDADAPAGFVAGDADFVYFRLRVDQDPTQGGSFRPFGWGVAIDSDGDLSAYELLAMVDGISNPDEVALRQNTTPATNSARDPAETVLATYDTATHARVVQAESTFGGDADFFIDWAIARADLDAAGIDTSMLRFAFGTSNNAQTLASDLGATTTAQNLDQVVSDPVGCAIDACVACAALCGSACLVCEGATPACDGQACVECATGSDCPASKPICDRSSHTCMAGAGCASHADCTDPELPACQPDGSCAECAADLDTACDGTTPLCDVDVGRCVGCRDDGDCHDPALPACQPNGSCGECSAKNDARCTGDTPVCELSSGRCALPCEDDGDCKDPSLPACQPRGSCGQCSATHDGVCDPTLEACNVAAGLCAEACSQSTDCPSVRPFCRGEVVCTECTADDTSACPIERPACDVMVGLCIPGPCQEDADCHNPALPACVDQRCTQCSATNSSRCTGSLPICDVDDGICVARPRGADTGDAGTSDDGGPGGGGERDGGAPSSPTGRGATIEGGGLGCAVREASPSGSSFAWAVAAAALACARRRRLRRR